MLANLTDEENELFEERAAIREFEGGEPRDLAEKRALREILKTRKENELSSRS